MLERLFKYGTGITAKLTLGKEFATTPRLHIDDQLSSLFSASRQLIADLVDEGRSWLSSEDKATALRKLRAMRFEFGTQCNLVEYELYRRTSDADHDAHLPAPLAIQNSERRGAPRRWNQYSLPRVLFDLYSLAAKRGILEALTRSGSSLDADFLSRPWWSIATIDAYENISACLESQYQPFLAKGTRMRTLEMDFLDNAIMYPLFRLYRKEVTMPYRIERD
ncbi:hypothetical protein MTO96_005917 [Rhipicephalus appendiculatus]